MSSTGLTRQYIRDAGGKQIGVILPIDEYQALVRLQPKMTPCPPIGDVAETHPQSLYGALRHLGGTVAPTEDLDETRRELWAVWDPSSRECRAPVGALDCSADLGRLLAAADKLSLSVAQAIVACGDSFQTWNIEFLELTLTE